MPHFLKQAYSVLASLLCMYEHTGWEQLSEIMKVGWELLLNEGVSQCSSLRYPCTSLSKTTCRDGRGSVQHPLEVSNTTWLTTVPWWVPWGSAYQYCMPGIHKLCVCEQCQTTQGPEGMTTMTRSRNGPTPRMSAYSSLWKSSHGMLVQTQMRQAAGAEHHSRVIMEL